MTPDVFIYHMKELVISNPNTSLDTFEKLSNDCNQNVRIAVAKNPNTPADILRKFADDEEEQTEVQLTAAENPNTPVDALRKLADEGGLMTQLVFENPSSPEDLKSYIRNKQKKELAEQLERFSNGERCIYVIFPITQNPDTPPEILREIAKNPPKIEDFQAPFPFLLQSMCNIARNPNTPVDVLKYLAEGKNPDFRFYVARNPQTPADILKKLAEEDNLSTLMAVAINPNTDEETLRFLSSEDLWAKIKNMNTEKLEMYLKNLDKLYNEQEYTPTSREL